MGKTGHKTIIVYNEIRIKLINMKILKDIFYIHYYHKKYTNKLLVIGFLRGIFKFKLFFYFYLTKLRDL
jgi:hypothetical protein